MRQKSNFGGEKNKSRDQKPARFGNNDRKKTTRKTDNDTSSSFRKKEGRENSSYSKSNSRWSGEKSRTTSGKPAFKKEYKENRGESRFAGNREKRNFKSDKNERDFSEKNKRYSDKPSYSEQKPRNRFKEDNNFDFQPKRRSDRDDFSSERKSERRRDDFNSDYSPKRSSYGQDKPDNKKYDRKERSDSSLGYDKKPYRKKDSFDDNFSSERKSERRRDDFDGDYSPKRSSYGQDKPDNKKYDRKERSDSSLGYDKKPYRKKDSFDDNFSSERKSERRRDDFDGDYSSKRSSYGRRSPDEKKSFHKKADRKQVDDGLTRLNKYLSNAGICSRREADELIEAGSVTVNGQVITQLGFKVNPGDKVVYGGDRVRTEKKVYLLLNKPKDYITTTDDPQERRTVMDLIKGACKERVYPVGRLDRNTTGVLLLTNDGETAKKLLHPKHGIAKVYQVTLDKNVSKEDMDQLYDGIELEDGFAKVDNIAYASPLKSKKEIGVEIHSGKNRIVRRMFEQLGYKVAKLDRVSFAGLTKKDLSRGKHRFLTESEIGFLKMIS